MNSDIQELVKDKLSIKSKNNTYTWTLKLNNSLNIGHLVPLFTLADVLKKSAFVKIFIDDFTDKPSEIMNRRSVLMKDILLNFFKKMECNTELISFCCTSEIRNNEEYVMDFYKMISVTTESQVIKTIYNTSDNLKLYNYIEPILFINDLQSVSKSNILIGENKESFCELSKNVLNDIHKDELSFISHPVIRDYKGNVMSKSNKNTSINITDGNNNINNKIKKFFCEEGNLKTDIFDIYEFIIFPSYERKGEELVVEKRDNISTTYKNIESLKEDFVMKQVHPGDLKDTCAKNVLRILDSLFDRSPEYLKKLNSAFN
ncbi:Tyrosyl-tRNA synthetase [Nosema bombycis CQ1]|uniref:tyrosine--tRNA ligase n=1 Tax=Nosema bombycis (strain CQ1 / CVCC 102059) TaxID=578461 RepID=R0MIX3_NOSB1|nr:Tyrosyl-tRNA synthetase [Nosema bombycis CQ1]|eukprot:EOB12748.1 Tyrosyl-tRNA synthetase [Nosema bombycis CQ1]